MEEEQQQRQPNNPAWLFNLIRAEFYEPCKIHPTKQCNFFCLHCNASPFCKNCQEGNDHGDHQDKVLQVYRASKHTGIRTSDATKNLLDISDIQPYKINAYTIVYINERPQQGDGVASMNKHCPRCQICQRELSARSCRFCSIKCKLNGNNGSGLVTNSSEAVHVIPVVDIREEIKQLSKESGEISTSANEDDEPISYRTRPRKGIPQRAPFC